MICFWNRCKLVFTLLIVLDFYSIRGLTTYEDLVCQEYFEAVKGLHEKNMKVKTFNSLEHEYETQD